MKIVDRVIPAAGQESVWDYPRPPRIEDVELPVRIIFNDVVFVETNSAKRVLETSHPPVYYLPPADIQMDYLKSAPGSSYCEWKGMAKYYDLQIDKRRIEKAGWYYPDPVESFESIKNYVAFYAGSMDGCFVADEQVLPQPGGFYGGWITKNIVGPFKGEEGTMFW